jgi:hypothetical protein
MFSSSVSSFLCCDHIILFFSKFPSPYSKVHWKWQKKIKKKTCFSLKSFVLFTFDLILRKISFLYLTNKATLVFRAKCIELRRTLLHKMNFCWWRNTFNVASVSRALYWFNSTFFFCFSLLFLHKKCQKLMQTIVEKLCFFVCELLICFISKVDI